MSKADSSRVENRPILVKKNLVKGGAEGVFKKTLAKGNQGEVCSKKNLVKGLRGKSF